MSDSLITPVILSGGTGTRLWPMSRPERPKQLLALTAAETMLQQTAARTLDPTRFAAPIVVAGARHADLIEEQLDAIGTHPHALILEPVARNTAPAIALAAIEAGDDALMLVMPSDHVIADVEAFRAAIAAAEPLARVGWLVTFGIAPAGPETGYGYIAVGEQLAAGVHRVARFIEKPKREAAEAMLAEGNHAWNGGIFLFGAATYLDALATYAPGMLDAARESMAAAARSNGRLYPALAPFEASPADSIDYAVMEKAGKVAVAPVDMGWSDVGSWDALHAISDCDEANNSCHGDVTAIDVSNSIVRTDGPRVSILGVSGLIVVVANGEVMIAPRARAQEVKKLAEAAAKAD